MANEKRLIDANAVDYENIMCSLSQLRWLNAIIERQPTVDAVEVVHGKWDKPSKYGLGDKFDGLGVVCSACADYCDNLYRYCPNCGAKMDGDGNGNL